MHQVLIRRNHGHNRAQRLGLFGIGRDQIIRLIPLHLDGGQAERGDGFVNKRKLRDQFFRRIGTMALIIRIDVISKIDPLGIKDHRHIIRIGLFNQIQQHAGDAKHRIGGRAVRPVHWWQGKEGAENIA